MKVEGDIEAGPAAFQGIKLPHDGKLGLFSNMSPKLQIQLSKQVLLDWAQKSRANVRPWSVFFSTQRFKAPASAQRLPRRVVKNIEYFQSNYLFVFAGLFLYCLITSPLLLIAFLLQMGVFYWIYLRNQAGPVIVFGRPLTLPQQYSLVGLVFMPIFYIVGAGAVLFWVLGASCFLIMTHAVFYDSQGLTEPEEESFELTMEQVV